MYIAYECLEFIFSDRKDKTAWLGETKDRKIGFFNSENVQEQFNYDSLDGKYNKICLYFLKDVALGARPKVILLGPCHRYMSVSLTGSYN